jgi:hypothetical protein
MRNFERLTLPAAAVAAFIAVTPVHANTLVDDGITYDLTAVVLNSTTDEFTLTISGINAASDTEGGRSGVNAIAFVEPSNFVSAVMITPPSGFTYQTGGLNSSGCDGKGNFFCFSANSTPPNSPALAADSTLAFVFDVTVSSSTFTGFEGFKIDWIGDKNNYDLVSKPLSPTWLTPPPPATPATPLPGAVWLFGTVLAAGAGFGRWCNKRKNVAALTAA